MVPVLLQDQIAIPTPASIYITQHSMCRLIVYVGLPFGDHVDRHTPQLPCTHEKKPTGNNRGRNKYLLHVYNCSGLPSPELQQQIEVFKFYSI